MSLVLENVSFSQELNDTFQQPVEELSFELRKIRNSLQNKGVGPGDNLITDLVSIVQQENEDSKIGDIR